jgi:integrase
MVYGKRADAERLRREKLSEIDKGAVVMPTKLTFAQFIAIWLRDYAETNVRARSLESYRDTIRRELIPAFGGLELQQLTAQHVRALMAKMTGRGLAPATVNRAYRLLHEILACAVKWEYVVRNVSQGVDPPRQVRREMRTLDADGVRRLFDAFAGHKILPFVQLAVWTGMRRSELGGLRWRDVDLENATIRVVQGIHRLRGGTYITEPPKSERGRRSIALPLSAVDMLRAYRRTQSTIDPERLVFSSSDGTPWSPDQVTQSFLWRARRTGFDGLRLHDLRHTSATLLFSRNVHPKVVQERLGHHSVALTLDTYSHTLPGMQGAAAQILDDILATAEVRRDDAVS